MKAILKNLLLALIVVTTGSGLALGQERMMQFWNPNDLRGLNKFETSKEDTIGFDGLKVRVGGTFAQQFQNLYHKTRMVYMFQL